MIMQSEDWRTPLEELLDEGFPAGPDGRGPMTAPMTRELLVTKAGKGSQSVGTTPLEIKEAKPPPASD